MDNKVFPFAVARGIQAVSSNQEGGGDVVLGRLSSLTTGSYCTSNLALLWVLAPNYYFDLWQGSHNAGQPEAMM
jgi:hypothetical protein